jgi:riboflavin kinase / FMN adenylyltransferase
MQVLRHTHAAGRAKACALTIGNFDGVHRGHQAMLALLINEARHRCVPSCVMMFEPHPRDYFARAFGKPDQAPARVGTLRDNLAELAACGLDQVVLLRFDAKLARQSATDFIEQHLVRGLGVRYVLVGDDFRFGAQRAGDYALLDAAGQQRGFDVARMNSYEVHGARVSSSAVRTALAQGDMARAADLLGRPYAVSGHVVHGAKLGRQLGATDAQRSNGFRTLNLRFRALKSAASGIFVVRVHGLVAEPVAGVASLGVRPSLDPSDVNGGRVLLETHVLDWPAELGAEGGYGRCIRVELLHKLHDERKYPSLAALQDGIAADVVAARAWFAARLKSVP